MTKLRLLMAAVLFPTALPAVALADAPAASACVQALEQVEALQTAAPVYKLTAGGERGFIHDAERPAEIARLQEVIRASCGSDPKARASQEAEAQRLFVTLSPECANERDKLAAMQQPSSREPDDAIEQQRRLVAGKCPAVDARGLWLVHWMGRGDLQP
jgi:hypothetical protein